MHGVHMGAHCVIYKARLRTGLQIALQPGLQLGIQIYVHIGPPRALQNRVQNGGHNCLNKLCIINSFDKH